MSSFTAGWYLLYTRPKHERKVTEHLATQKLDYYLPMHRTVRNHGDRARLVTTPLFSSYVFIRLEKHFDYYAALNTDGVLYYVRSGGKVARIGDAVIKDLKLLVEHGGDLEVTSTQFRVGQKLTISEGPLTGLSCEMVEYLRKKRILVRITLLERNILLEMPMEQVVIM